MPPIFLWLYSALNLYQWLLSVYIILSWFPNTRSNPIVQILEKVCEPYLSLFRGILPLFGALDLSPVLAYIALDMTKSFLRSW